MSLKKKLGMAIMTGALGVGLIGGGTWAAFNDVETIQNTFAAGTLDLAIGQETTINMPISNLKPGDYFTHYLVLENKGSLHINQIFLTGKTVEEVWKDKDVLGLNERITVGAGNNTQEEFLSQFDVQVIRDGHTVFTGSLADIASDSVGEITGTDDKTIGLEVNDNITYEIRVEFREDYTRFDNSRLYVQNKYQGEQSNVELIFEATQMKGEAR